MIKYRVTKDNNSTEFINEQDALSYANIISGTIEQITEPDILPPTAEELEIILAKKKREFGTYVAQECIDLLGARNKTLGLTGTQVTAMLQNLMPIKSLLETGALSTARYYITQMLAAYPSHADVFQDGINDINEFEAENGL